ncbi:MAG: menaquinone biosynthesis protein [Bryobacteraceae bacterium]
MNATNSIPRLRVCAVSYLNTVPLVWGMLHGEQKGLFDLRFRVPAECADMVGSGAADMGIIPSFELLGRDYGIVPGVGIACRGAVRSILLVSSRPAHQIRTLAADASSRTSVALARIVLARRYGVEPAVATRPPDLPGMLGEADSALIIGDPALHINPATTPLHVYDLGREWTDMTGLPMVFAVWAGPREFVTPQVVAAFQDSCACGLRSLERIVAQEAAARGFAPELVRRYLASHIVFELGEPERQGMELFLRYARQLDPLRRHPGLTPASAL